MEVEWFWFLVGLVLVLGGVISGLIAVKLFPDPRTRRHNRFYGAFLFMVIMGAMFFVANLVSIMTKPFIEGR
jgi:hypothetical protein